MERVVMGRVCTDRVVMRRDVCRKGYNGKGHIWPVSLTLYSRDPILFFSWYFPDDI